MTVATPNNAAVRKINSDETMAWMSALLFQPIIKSLSLDGNEQNAYIGSMTNNLNVWRLATSNGAIIDAQTL